MKDNVVAPKAGADRTLRIFVILADVTLWAAFSATTVMNARTLTATLAEASFAFAGVVTLLTAQVLGDRRRRSHIDRRLIGIEKSMLELEATVARDQAPSGPRPGRQFVPSDYWRVYADVLNDLGGIGPDADS